MAVVGVDFGTLASKIGVARHRGIDIIANEVSNRATPSLVAFGPKQRAIGEAAKTQETSNFKNTIGSLKRLIGRTLNDPDVQDIEKKFINAALVDVQGTVGVEINYLGERQKFSATQLVAMYLGRLRDTASAELKTTVSDIVIAVPGWFTDVQRRAILDAASIANLNVLRIINDTTAAALGYGITKADLPEADNPKHVAFIDVGHSSLSVAIVAYSKGQLIVKSTAYDRNLGGRDIDYALVKHFAAEFKEKYKIDVLSNPKAVFRLAAATEKLKKVLSANAEAPINVESIMNDIDASSKLTRDDLEGLIADELSRIVAPIQRAIDDSGLNLDEIEVVELIGGSSRIPAVRARIAECFPGKTLSTTLNQDEAVARGATFSCAMLSPVFRVREFSVSDINAYPIKVQWAPVPSDPEEDTELVVFGEGNAMPSTKILSFYRKDPFDIEAVYAKPENLPGGINPWIAKFTAKEVPLLGQENPGDPVQVKLKTRLNANGILGFEGAYVETREDKDEPAPMDGVEGGEAAAAPPKKKKIIKHEVKFVVGNSAMDKGDVEKLKEQENSMWENDKLVKDTEDRKNALEEYIYDTRSKLDDRYAPFVQQPEKDALLALLTEQEDWLYTEEGEDATKSTYVQRLDACKALGDPIYNRWRESEDRQRSIASLRETLNTYMAQATSSEEKFSHIDEKDKQSVVEKVAVTQKWLEDMTVRQMEREKFRDPVLTTAEISKKRDEVIYFATPILTKPKPKPPVVPTPTGSGAQTPKTEPEPEAKKEAPGPSEMDVD
ncbi:MAG: heat shock protein 70 family [Lentinula lateritia]|uniref:Heat shock protein 70 family n=1 Tax=Lentinula lateritia TaxID=40482 RepID=A0ABQ8V020_9AGAR|nr:MAG: heat shock protein 70 family [Lentinula lateritia]KAJ4463773.1 heat shock protein 70 family [Lentinula lateritia]